ncbi:MAG TPA: spore coat protein CotH, partial [Ruminococcaceae bacterium]|nr:spore coat protein CotH [Oscillospiraceae bacterium]
RWRVLSGDAPSFRHCCRNGKHLCGRRRCKRYVHTIDIVMNDWESFIETCENEEYTSCTVVIDGKKHSNIAIRAKGNTSLSTVSTMNSDRYSFKLEFDHYDSSNTLDGLDKLCLNNLIQDNTMMKDYIVYQMMNDFGVDTPLCSFAYLTVNGEDWGLYLAVEGVEDSFLSRNYGSDVGELYKPDSMSFGGGRGNGKDFNMDDFDFDAIGENAQGGSVPQMPSGESATVPSMPEGQQSEGTERQSGFPTMPNGGFNGQGNMPSMPNGDSTVSMPDFSDLFDGEMPDMSDFGGGDQQMGGNMGGGMGSDDVKLKYIDDDPDSYSNIFDNAKTAVSDKDKTRLIASLKQLNANENIEDIVDIEEVIRYFVVHNFVVNFDSYTGSMIHNYYLYEKDGKMSMIPWDYNLAFGGFQGAGNATSLVNYPIDSPVSGGTIDSRPMLAWIFNNNTYTELYHQYFREFTENLLNEEAFTAEFDRVKEMIAPFVQKDPTKFCTYEEFEKGVETLREFCLLRAESIQGQLDGTIPSTSDGQSADSSSLIQASSITISDMGSMGNMGKGGPNSSAAPADKSTEKKTQTQNEENTTATASSTPSAQQAPPEMPSGGFNGTPPDGAPGAPST